MTTPARTRGRIVCLIATTTAVLSSVLMVRNGLNAGASMTMPGWAWVVVINAIQIGVYVAVLAGYLDGADTARDIFTGKYDPTKKGTP